MGMRGEAPPVQAQPAGLEVDWAAPQKMLVSRWLIKPGIRIFFL